MMAICHICRTEVPIPKLYPYDYIKCPQCGAILRAYV